MDKTSADKWELIEALYQHGTNTEALKTALPKWSTSQLNATIRRFRRRAKKKTSEDEKGALKLKAPLEQWIDLIGKVHLLQGSTDQPRRRRGRKAHNEVPKDHVPLLGKVMMYAACFEEHYQGTEPDDPNYSEIYRYLAQLLEGKEPTQLRPGSAAKVLEMLNRIKKVMSDGSVLEHMQYLQKLPISYLHSETSKKTQENAARGPAPNMKSSDVDPVALACPLFQDAEEEVHNMELEPEDPYYEVKREKVVKKLETVQQESAAHLQFISGLNPLELPTKFMVKPTVTTVNPARSKVSSQMV
ncbi:uncharacterized protein [Panulirus ornatus]|uniref:uncharacterized protein isoform X1 n=1 Tax=Panulirus ornatus TaxID=150431 RepID=UPI003A867AFC